MTAHVPKRRAPWVSSAPRLDWARNLYGFGRPPRRNDAVNRGRIGGSRCWLALRRASQWRYGSRAMRRRSCLETATGGIFAVSVAALASVAVLAGFCLRSAQREWIRWWSRDRSSSESCLRVDEGQTGNQPATARRKALAGHLHPGGRESCSDQRRPNESVAPGASQHGRGGRARWWSIPRKKREEKVACGCA